MTIASEYWDDPFDALVRGFPVSNLAGGSSRIVRPDPTVNPERTLWIPLGVFRVWNVETAGNAEGGFEIPLRAYSIGSGYPSGSVLEHSDGGNRPDSLGARAIRDVIHRLVEDTFQIPLAAIWFLSTSSVKDSGWGTNFQLACSPTSENDLI